MSIFKSTFKPYVVRQISARQNLLTQKDRPPQFSQYVSAKSPWVRMTSFVDYNESSDLAKKYILMGGTLYDFNTDKGSVRMRAGLGGRGAAYGGDLGSRQYGIRPMPGITDVSTRNISAYGSLTEATVKFYAWDVKQLEDLSVLFLRPGYKVLLEWGWSMYLNTIEAGESYKSRTNYKTLNSKYNDFTISNTPFNTINCFDENINQDFIYDQLDILRHKYSANYDGVLGYIKNFNYVLMPNGSYECTTVLISIGDVIDTIRINDTIGINIGDQQAIQTTPPNPQTSTEAPIDQVNYSEIKSQFEILFDEYCKLSESNPRDNSSIIKSIDSVINPNDANYIDPYIYKYNSGYSLTPNQALSPIEKARSDFEVNLGVPGTATANNTTTRGPGEGTTVYPETDQPVTVSQDNPGDKRSYYYMQFGYFIHILNVFKTLFTDKGGSLVNLEIPSDPNNLDSISNGLCQASFNSISIDPNVAIIRNSRATLFTDAEGGKGFRPQIFKTENVVVSGPVVADYNMQEYLYSNTNFGQIRNIYVNIKTIISVYKSQLVSNNGYVYLGQFISEILSKISFSLGSINDFDKFVTNNKIAIIDKHYTELPSESKYDSKFKINIAGVSTIVRSHKIESKIFPSQATMVAIAAQDRENIASIQTSTYNYLNQGLSDRLIGGVNNFPVAPQTDDLSIKKSLLNSILTLIQYVNEYVIVNKTISAYYASNVGAMNSYLNTLLVQMEGGTDYKAVVPISVDLEIDGISGLTIGEIFTVDKRVLPKDYVNKSIGFIITRLSNKITTDSWTTKIESQMCILDQEEKQLKSAQKAEALFGDLARQTVENKSDNYTSIKYYNILGALVIDSLRKKIIIVDDDGNFDLSKSPSPLYVRSALSEYAAGEVSLSDILIDYNNSFKRLYPAPLKKKELQTTVKRVDPILVYENDIKDPETILNTIKGTSYYQAMVPVLKSYFDQELNRVFSGYRNYGKQVDFWSWEYVSLSWEGGERVLSAISDGELNPTTLNKINNSPITEYNLKSTISTTFFKIDINTSVDTNTGLLRRPISFVRGYSYWLDGENQ